MEIDKIMMTIKNKMKPMEYFPEPEFKGVLFEGKCYNYQFYILNLGTHPTAYVEIPRTNKLFRKNYNDIWGIEVHGGLTFSENYIYGITKPDNRWFIGWDYAHGGDYLGYEMLFQDRTFARKDKKWTTEEIFEDVVSVVKQVMKKERY